MKKSFFAIMAGLFVLSNQGLAEQNVLLNYQNSQYSAGGAPANSVGLNLQTKKNRISFGPLGLLIGSGGFTYERAITPNIAIEISPSFIYWGFSDDKLYGGGLGLGASYYLSGRAPEGLRLNASVLPGFVTADPDAGKSESIFIFGAKLLFGYNWVWQNGFTLGLGGGFQYINISTDSFDGAINGVLPALDFNIGFVW